jgi:N-acetylmuramic acid 6-phosphate etherase
MSRGHLLTEQANPLSQNLDQLSPLEIVELFNLEDAKAVAAVAAQKENIARAIAIITEAMRNGGRLFYVGAGTSGRLGVLDAAECPPTFCTDPELVQGIIAGGNASLVRSSEALEDLESDGARRSSIAALLTTDVVFGITAGGTTPYVHGALQTSSGFGSNHDLFCLRSSCASAH